MSEKAASPMDAVSVDNAPEARLTDDRPYRHARLRELSALLPNWDSYGGDPPTAEALRSADAVTFVPCNDGGMQVELHAGGMDIEVYIEPSGAIFGVSAEKTRARR